MLKQYIGPRKEGVNVSVRGVDFGLVLPGEAIAVPDELAESVGWNPKLWQDVKPAVEKMEDE